MTRDGKPVVALGRRPLIDPLPETGELAVPVELPDAGNTSNFVVRREGDMRSDVKRLFGGCSRTGVEFFSCIADLFALTEIRSGPKT